MRVQIADMSECSAWEGRGFFVSFFRVKALELILYEINLVGCMKFATKNMF